MCRSPARTLVAPLVAGALLALVPAPGTATAAEDDVTAALAAVGEVNGTALACGEMDTVRTIKAGVVEAVPKLRAYGKTFEAATNDAFLTRTSSGGPCPEPDHLRADAKARLDALRAAAAGG